MSTLVLFDIDMTLIDTAGAGREAFRRTWNELHPELEYPKVAFAGRTDPLIVADIATSAGLVLDDGRMAEFIKRFKRLYVSKHLPDVISEHKESGELRTIEGAIKLAKALHERGVPIGLVTGNWVDGAKIKLDAYNLWHYFPIGGFGSDSSNRNHLPVFAIQRAQEYFEEEFAPNDVWVIGDSLKDIECARSNRLNSIGVATGFETKENLEQAGATIATDSLDDTDRFLEILIK